jgi:predicted oxidoreductase (fatty acid repression mutant protein)
MEEHIQRLVQEELKKQPSSGNSTPPTIVIRDV